MVTGAERRAGLDAQGHRAQRDQPLVMGAVDEEPPGANRRQAGQRHGQPVGVGELVGDHPQAREAVQDGDQGGLFVVGVREGVDAPDVPRLVFLEDGIGQALGDRILVDRDGGGLGHGARASRNGLNGIGGHRLRLAAMAAKG